VVQRSSGIIDRKVKTIRALDRGVEVLSHIQQERGLSLSELHNRTGLPKATLLRVLVTLSRHGLVWQRLADGAYLPGFVMRARPTPDDEVGRLVEIASPIMAELVERVAWPSVLAVPRLDYMEVVETNSPRSSVEHLIGRSLGYRIDYVHSATGRAYLAFCEERERQSILGRLQITIDQPGDGERLAHALRDARERGFGSREPLLAGRAGAPPFDGRHSIGCPVMIHGRPMAVVNLTWPSRMGSVATVAGRTLPYLQAATRQMAERFMATEPQD